MTHKILRKLEHDLATLVALVEPLSEKDLDRHYGEGWTIRQILTHLWNAEEDHCRVIAIIARGDLERLPRELNLDEHNATRLTEREHHNKVDLLSGITTQRERTISLFDQLSETQLSLEGRHPALGQISIEKIFRIIGIHMKMHSQEIAEALQ